MKVTVITVCFNSAASIEDTLTSVARQTHPDIEHIVIDGASTDGTVDVVLERGKHVERLISEPDRGIYDAMNKGILLASGDVIGFINADDFYPSDDVLSKVAAVFGDPNIDACYGDLCYVKQADIGSVVRYWCSCDFTPGLFARGWCPPHPTLFVRREIYQRLGGFDLSYRIAADMELMARLIEVHRIRTRYLPSVLVHMRMGGTTNRSLRNIVQQNREIWQALKTHRLDASAWFFLSRKLVARGRQFLGRPS
jgi:glycosyltransferase involved in cell wall biosynthesis